MAGAIAEIAKQALRRRVRPDRAADRARRCCWRAAPTILASYVESLRDSARQALVGLGVEVRERALVTDLDEDAVRVGEERIAAGTIVWAAGVQASPLGRTLGAPLDRLGRVVVRRGPVGAGSPRGVRRRRPHAQAGRRRSADSGVAQAAMQAGRARRRQRRAASAERARRRPSAIADLGNMATIGRARAIADLGWLRLTGYPAWLAWLFLHLVFLIGFKNRVVVLVQWLVAYVTRQRGVRLITGTNGRLPDRSRPASLALQSQHASGQCRR